MGTWFDSRAKRMARSGTQGAVSDATGPTRRDVLVRGAVITGTAWTVPMLMTAPAAAQAATSPLRCPAGETESTCPPGTIGPRTRCCPRDSSCGTSSVGVNGCVDDTVAGGNCGNSGNGQCGTGGQGPRCNGQPKPFNVCGGPGAGCGATPSENCAPGLTCVIGSGPAGSPGTCLAV